VPPTITIKARKPFIRPKRSARKLFIVGHLLISEN
jgi:hypothetical protein